MKASELIIELEKAIKEYGDINVIYGGCHCCERTYRQNISEVYKREDPENEYEIVLK